MHSRDVSAGLDEAVCLYGQLSVWGARNSWLLSTGTVADQLQVLASVGYCLQLIFSGESWWQ